MHKKVTFCWIQIRNCFVISLTFKQLSEKLSLENNLKKCFFTAKESYIASCFFISFHLKERKNFLTTIFSFLIHTGTLEMSATLSRWISVIGGSTLLVTGTVGALFNIFIFTHRSLRKCSCSWYLLAAAFCDLLTLDHPLLLRILADGFDLDLVSMSNIYCKVRFFTGQTFSFAPITFTCLAAVDRWAVSYE
jgi:hypothetical protein